MIPLLIALIIIVLFALARAWEFGKPIDAQLELKDEEVDVHAAAQHLAAAVRCETVSHGENEPPARQALLQLHDVLKASYPRITAALQRETVNEYSLLYQWRGSDPALDPVVFCAHLDVVPADPATLSDWKYPPFSGEIAEGFVWGRGTIDIKNQVIAVHEAVEHLLEKGFQPRRSIYLAFGHDEEIGGPNGARQIVETLRSRGVKLAAVIDEGGAVVSGIVPGVKTPVATVGVGEKGYMTLELSVECPPGHSATPPKQTSIGILAQALARLEANPLPAQVKAAMPLFHAVGRRLPFSMRVVFANLWLTERILRQQLEANPQTNAMIRTTTAVTMIGGGIKDNILPRQARAAVNFRLLPGDTPESVKAYVKKIIQDERVHISDAPATSWKASPLSPGDSPFFQALEGCVQKTFGPVPVAPYLVLGATDARYYSAICPNVYRFMPAPLDSGELGRMHGIGERISLEGLGMMVKFFLHLMRAWAG